MFKEIFFLFLIGHVLGDFYFQSETMAHSKNESFKYLTKHSLIYCLSMIIVFIPIMNKYIIFGVLIVAFLHFIIDYYKGFIHRKFFPKTTSSKIYCLDQLIHIAVLLIITVCMSGFDIPIQFINIFQILSQRCSFNFLYILSWILIVLLILKPTSITIKIILENYQQNISESDKGVPNTGALIGKLERIFILMMLVAGQYSAIGLILTAKSIVRYEKIIKTPEFSEYYLLGTLLSTLSVIIFFNLIF